MISIYVAIVSLLLSAFGVTIALLLYAVIGGQLKPFDVDSLSVILIIATFALTGIATAIALVRSRRGRSADRRFQPLLIVAATVAVGVTTSLLEPVSKLC